MRRIAALSLILAALILGAGGGAVAGSLVTSAQIKDGSILSRDVRNGTLGRADLRPRVVARLDRAVATRVEYGPPRTWGTGENFSTASCDDGFVAINGGVRVASAGSDKWQVESQSWPEGPRVWGTLGWNNGAEAVVVPWVLCVRR